MTGFELAKKQMMLLITLVVVVFVVISFYVMLSSFQVGSRVDVSNREVEMVALRALKCIENNEVLDNCVKTDDFALKFIYKDKTYFVNKNIFEKWSLGQFVKGEFEGKTLIREGMLYPKIQVVFKT